MKKITDIADFPKGLSQPALRALAAAGVKNVAGLAKLTVKELAGLHGMGPKGVRMLTEAMQEKGVQFGK